MGRLKHHGIGRCNIHGDNPTKHASEGRQLGLKAVRDGKGAVAAMQASFPSHELKPGNSIHEVPFLPSEVGNHTEFLMKNQMHETIAFRRLGEGPTAKGYKSIRDPKAKLGHTKEAGTKTLSLSEPRTRLR